MRKFIIIIVVVIVCFAAGGAVFLYLNFNQNNYTDSTELKMTAYFNSHYAMMNEMKNYLLPEQFNNSYVNNDGSIHINNGNMAGDKVFSADVKQYFNSIPFPQTSIECRTISNHKSIEFRFYFKSNRVIAGFVYTEADLKDDSAYKQIEENWYFYEQGMV